MPVLVYSVLRILLIIIAGAALYLAGTRGLLLVVGAVLIGAALSYLILDRYRRASAQWLQSRGKGHTKVEDRFEADAEAEDAMLDEQEGQHRGAEAADVPESPSCSDGQGDGKADPDQ